LIRFLFLLISSLGLLMALGTVLARNLVHAALFLVGFFFIIACEYVLLEAEFLAVVQVLIYIGAVAILLMFGIMLTRNIQGDETTTVRWPTRLPAVLAGVGVLIILVMGIGEQVGVGTRPSWRQVETRPVVNPPEKGEPPSVTSRHAGLNDMARTIGYEMMTRYVIAFEVAGLLLTAAVVGAVALAQLEGPTETPRDDAFGVRHAAGSNGNGAPPAATSPIEPTLTSASSPR
jgi:NADH-quinone oxidoreductase subunit J